MQAQADVELAKIRAEEEKKEKKESRGNLNNGDTARSRGEKDGLMGSRSRFRC